MITTIPTQDGSNTAYSALFNEHYHSTKDGALNESLHKHVIPALLHVKDRDSISILDICFGLGFNTLATLHYLHVNKIQKQVSIVSPEFDGALVRSLANFEYPKIFTPFASIIKAISDTGEYSDEHLHVKVIIDDARAYLRRCEERFDIVYHDAFSPAVNPTLWTQEYFADIARLIKDDGILTTYSMALKTRLALHVNGFNVYLNHGEGYRSATLASKSVLDYTLINMKHKIACNPNITTLKDAEVLEK